MDGKNSDVDPSVIGDPSEARAADPQVAIDPMRVPHRDERDRLRERIANDFYYSSPHTPSGVSEPQVIADRHEEVRRQCRFVADRLVSIVPSGRELSMALTKLEEAMYWANAGVARNQEGAIRLFRGK